MTLKQIILLILLTAALIILSYTLLEIIDRHLGLLLIILLSGMVIGDILLLSRFFLRFMKTPGHTKGVN